MRKLVRFFGIAVVSLVTLASTPSFAASRTDFKVCWTIYAGWMPWGEPKTQGIVSKWAKKYGINVDVVQLNDYVESINQYTAGKFDGCAMTNMDALTIPASGGVDSTALIVSDYSNGNDGVLIKGKGKKLTDLKGQQINLVQFSVSHYLLARALESAHMTERDLKVVNTSDADISAAFATPAVQQAVTWNPMLADLKAQPNVTEVFDSSKIPGEIMDLMVVNTAVLKENPDFAKALVGIWYETIAKMNAAGAEGTAAKEAMAKASGTDLAGFDSQLASTRLFDKAVDAEAFTKSATVGTTMDRVRKFLFEKALLGKDAKSADAVGIELADKAVLGNKSNVKLRFDATYMDAAAKGKL